MSSSSVLDRDGRTRRQGSAIRLGDEERVVRNGVADSSSYRVPPPRKESRVAMMSTDRPSGTAGSLDRISSNSPSKTLPDLPYPKSHTSDDDRGFRRRGGHLVEHPINVDHFSISDHGRNTQVLNEREDLNRAQLASTSENRSHSVVHDNGRSAHSPRKARPPEAGRSFLVGDPPPRPRTLTREPESPLPRRLYERYSTPPSTPSRRIRDDSLAALGSSLLRPQAPVPTLLRTVDRSLPSVDDSAESNRTITFTFGGSPASLSKEAESPPPSSLKDLGMRVSDVTSRLVQKYADGSEIRSLKVRLRSALRRNDDQAVAIGKLEAAFEHQVKVVDLMQKSIEDIQYQMRGQTKGRRSAASAESMDGNRETVRGGPPRNGTGGDQASFHRIPSQVMTASGDESRPRKQLRPSSSVSMYSSVPLREDVHSRSPYRGLSYKGSPPYRGQTSRVSNQQDRPSRPRPLSLILPLELAARSPEFASSPVSESPKRIENLTDEVIQLRQALRTKNKEIATLERGLRHLNNSINAQSSDANPGSRGGDLPRRQSNSGHLRPDDASTIGSSISSKRGSSVGDKPTPEDTMQSKKLDELLRALAKMESTHRDEVQKLNERLAVLATEKDNLEASLKTQIAGPVEQVIPEISIETAPTPPPDDDIPRSRSDSKLHPARKPSPSPFAGTFGSHARGRKATTQEQPAQPKPSLSDADPEKGGARGQALNTKRTSVIEQRQAPRTPVIQRRSSAVLLNPEDNSKVPSKPRPQSRTSLSVPANLSSSVTSLTADQLIHAPMLNHRSSVISLKTSYGPSLTHESGDDEDAADVVPSGCYGFVGSAFPFRKGKKAGEPVSFEKRMRKVKSGWKYTT